MGRARAWRATDPGFARPSWAGVDSLGDEELRRAGSALADLPVSPGGRRSYLDRTNSLIRRVAARFDVPLVVGDSIRDPRLFVDLIHLDAEGCSRLANLVAPVVLRAADGPRRVDGGRRPCEAGPP